MANKSVRTVHQQRWYKWCNEWYHWNDGDVFDTWIGFWISIGRKLRHLEQAIVQPQWNINKCSRCEDSGKHIEQRKLVDFCRFKKVFASTFGLLWRSHCDGMSIRIDAFTEASVRWTWFKWCTSMDLQRLQATQFIAAKCKRKMKNRRHAQTNQCENQWNILQSKKQF